MPHERLWFPLMAHDGCADGPPRRYGCGGPGCQAGPRRRRLVIVSGSVLVAFVLAACSSAPSSHPSASKPSVGKLSPGAAPTRSASSADGPLACATAGRATGRTGPWKLVTPPALCQLQLQTSQQFQQSGKSLVTLSKILISMDDAGTVTSSIGVTYQGTSEAAQRATSFRSVSVVGFNGRFRPAAALSALEEQGSTYTSVSPGPHGGMLACANVEGSENCVWATPTTLCGITILDPTGELIGANSDANAVRIRNVLEVPG
jgi:hypothetical protein